MKDCYRRGSLFRAIEYYFRSLLAVKCKKLLLVSVTHVKQCKACNKLSCERYNANRQFWKSPLSVNLSTTATVPSLLCPPHPILYYPSDQRPSAFALWRRLHVSTVSPRDFSAPCAGPRLRLRTRTCPPHHSNP